MPEPLAPASPPKAKDLLLVNRTTGQRERVPLELASEAFATGEYGVQRGQSVPVQLADGRIGTVPAESIQETLEQGGRIVGQDALKHERAKEEFAGAGGAAKAFAGGLLRGALPAVPGTPLGGDKFVQDVGGIFGVGDQIGSAGHETELTQQERQRYALEDHPYASGAGEIAGMFAGAALSPGGGMVGGLGHLAEHGAERLVGKGASTLLGRVAQRGAALGARGAAEGAAIEAQAATSEEALGDPEANGEKLFSRVAKGALFGGGLGVALGGGSTLLGGLRRRAGEAATDAATKLPTVVEESKGIRAVADEQAFRALDARKAFVTQMEKIPGGVKGGGRALLNEGVIAAGDNIETIAPKLEAAHARAVSKLDDIVESMGAKIPDPESLLRKAAEATLPELQKAPSMNASAIRAVEGVLSDFSTTIGRIRSEVGPMSFGAEGRAVTFRDVRDFRSLIDKQINYARRDLPAAEEALRTIRNVFETELERVADDVAAKAGAGAQADYKAAKLNFRRLNVMNDAVQDSIARKESNRMLAPTDKAIGIAGALATGGPLGIMQGLAMGAVSKNVRERGNATVAAILDRFASHEAIARAANDVDTQIDSSVKRFFRAAKNEAPRISASSAILSEKEYQRRAERVQAMAARPALVAQSVNEHVNDVAGHSPNTARSLDATAARAATFLASKLPGPLTDTRGLPPYRKTVVSDMDRAAWSRYANAAEHPLSILKELDSGELTPESVEAVRVIYPKLFAQIQEHVKLHITELQNELSIGKLYQLGILLDVATDATLEPDFIRDMQAGYAPVSPANTNAPPAAPSVGPDTKLNTTDAIQSPMQAAASRR